MKLIVGLGNPGKRYAQTRHNLGFWVVEKIAGGGWQKKGQLEALISGSQPSGAFLLAKPAIYMNNCGVAVSKLLEGYHLRSEDLWVIHDDVDLSLGRVKIQESGKRSTHNGVQSIVEALGTTEFARFRLGIGRPPPATSREAFVLAQFFPDEEAIIKTMVKTMAEAIRLSLEKGAAAAMNRYNR